MMLTHFGEAEAAGKLQGAVERVYRDGKHLTGDVGEAPRPANLPMPYCALSKASAIPFVKDLWGARFAAALPSVEPFFDTTN